MGLSLRGFLILSNILVLFVVIMSAMTGEIVLPAAIMIIAILIANIFALFGAKYGTT